MGVALAESAFAGGLGAEIELAKVPYEGAGRDDFVLFSESASRFVVAVHPENAMAFEKAMKGVVFAKIGVAGGDEKFVVKGLNGKVVLSAGIGELKQAWQKTLRW